MDVSTVVAAIDGVSANVETIGLAVLIVLAVVAGISYLRRVVR